MHVADRWIKALRHVLINVTDKEEHYDKHDGLHKFLGIFRNIVFSEYCSS